MSSHKIDLVKDSLLFHPTHGLCRVSAVLQGPAPDEIRYELLPMLQHQAKIRYIVPQKMLTESGFHPLMTVRQAKSILEFFKTGKKKKSNQSGEAWAMAVVIHTESFNRENMKDSRMRQKLSLSVKALSAELAFILHLSVKEVCDAIRQNLRQQSAAINRGVLTALINAESDEMN